MVDDETDVAEAAADAEAQGVAPPRCGKSDGEAGGPAAPGGGHGAGNGRGTPLERAKRQLEVDPARLAKRLKAAREAKGWNRLDLATRADVAPSTVSNLERQQSASPDPVVALALALALGHESVAGLLGEGPAAALPPEGPGPMTLEALVASLLRGVWAAQGARPEARSVGPAAGLAEPGAVVEGLGRLTGPGATPVFVGAVFLLEPKTAG